MSVIPPTTPLSPPGASPRPYGAVFEAYVQRHHGGNGSSPVATLSQLTRQEADWHRIVENVVYLERFLNHADPTDQRLKHVVDAVQANLGQPAEEVRRAYVAACDQLKLCGGPASANAGFVTFGHVISQRKLVHALWAQYGTDEQNAEDGTRKQNAENPLFEKKRDVAQAVERFVEGPDVPAPLIGLRFRPDPAWITWSQASSGQPFDFLSRVSPAERKSFLLHCLGLVESRTNTGPLLVVQFPATPQTRLIRPTIADAGDYPHFRPPPSGIDAHGLTDWTGLPKPNRFSNAVRRPEALLDNLVFTAETKVQQL